MASWAPDTCTKAELCLVGDVLILHKDLKGVSTSRLAVGWVSGNNEAKLAEEENQESLIELSANGNSGSPLASPDTLKGPILNKLWGFFTGPYGSCDQVRHSG